MTTRFDELQQARAMLIRLLDDGKPLPPVQGVDDLSTDEGPIRMPRGGESENGRRQESRLLSGLDRGRIEG